MTVRPLKPPPGALQVSQNLPPRELQELWFATRRHEWRSLAVVPTADPAWALRIAEGLQQVAGLAGRKARVVNSQQMELFDIATLVMEMQSPPGSVWTSGRQQPSGAMGVDPHGDESLIIALPLVVANPLALPLALTAEAVVLVIELGSTDMETARRTIEGVGRDRLIGCVLVRDG